MTSNNTSVPLTNQLLDEIDACVNGPLGSATDFDHTTVAPLVAEVRRLRALLAQCDHRACAGFPDDCPNPVLVNPDPPAHFGGVRCGCRPAEALMVCIDCETPVGWVDCPTGGWWAHDTHPEDDHDAAPKPVARPAPAVAVVSSAVEEQPAVEPSEACGKCKQPFDPADTRFDGRARYHLTPYCRGCVDRCHDNEIADHRCVICA